MTESSPLSIPAKVLVIGLPKSGTTALLEMVARALEDAWGPTERVFEPEDLRLLDFDVRPLAVKKLLSNLQPSEGATFYGFDRRVLIVRDPRDRLVSWLLYDLYGREAATDPTLVDTWLDLLRRKEADPAGLPLVDLLYGYWEVSGVPLVQGLFRTLTMERNFWRKNRHRMYVFAYRDLVDGRLDDLTEYLGFSLGGSPELVGPERRVARTKSYGDWRNWFTPQDVRVFRPLLDEHLRSFGFESDWDLDAGPVIDPSRSSAYVASLVEQRRAEDEAAQAPGNEAAQTDSVE